MKKYFNKLLVGAVLLLAVACDPSDFGDLNVDPTKVSSASTKALLTNALQSLPGTMFGNNTSNFYVQYLSEGPYPGASLYSTVNFDWATTYHGPLANLQTIIDYNNANNPNADEVVNGAKANQIAVARILKAYYFWWLTDRYGDIPYFQALTGAKNFYPAYDLQKDIYYDIFKELTEAVAQLDESKAGPVGDILLGGDVKSWKLFANTVRLYAALRLIKNDYEKGKTEFNAAITAGILSSNSDNIFYEYIGGDPNNYNPWYTNYSVSNRNDYAISTTMTSYMQPLSDPRLPLYGEVLGGGVVKGLSYGSSAARNIPNAYSRIGDDFRGAGSPAALFTYAQTLFVLAEGTKAGYIAGGDAQAEIHYYNAIKASFEQNGVYTASGYSAYIANATVTYSAAEGLQKIIMQKWVHQYLNGYEAWADWRRTGFPVLTPAADGSISSIPRRQGYPTPEKSLNKKNYDAAIAIQGTDNLVTRTWWDK
ncbi:SusD/RagB family nutrient-binding outer membrane lipoprotein [Fulvivirgaceae bacterium PWU4]|uniref:SusD/RagB family nutrient-binding outer membrane lipoprotein n=1 Tax=Chryseosolibacter histidini TaxID=2782349 RepID=A0AAP2DQR0_9BACT|nr:SusD/RagB family nutrient-binding outer membrane lipoprotein [Chryseosolibacter histidini]MBT1699497.1 SusD/RagB family nutrient-binding outer membrane lipoprotein [Chryseosolibacter histidini]